MFESTGKKSASVTPTDQVAKAIDEATTKLKAAGVTGVSVCVLFDDGEGFAGTAFGVPPDADMAKVIGGFHIALYRLVGAGLQQ